MHVWSELDTHKKETDQSRLSTKIMEIYVRP